MPKPQLVPLGSLLTGIDAGHSPDVEDTPAGSREWGVLKVSAVGADGFHPQENKVVREQRLHNPALRVRAGDLLITRANTAQLVGLACIAEDTSAELMLSDKTLRLRVDKRVAPARYIQAALGSPIVRRQIENLATGTSGSMKNISQRSIQNLMIPFSGTEDAERIAEILDSADRLIEHQQSIICKRELLQSALAESLMREASTHPSHRLHSIIESAVDGPFGSNLKSEHYVEIPGTRVVRLQNIGTGKFLDGDRAYVENRHAAALAGHEVRGGDLLAASLGDARHPIARACIYPIHLPPGIVKADCFRLRLNPQIATNYYAMRALNSSVVAPAIRAAAQGVTRDRINLGSLLSLCFPVPPLSFQNEMKAAIEAEAKAVHLLECEIAKLKVAKQGLMEDLLTGRVRVTVLYRDVE